MLSKRERESFKNLIDQSMEENLCPYQEQLLSVKENINQTNETINQLSKDVSEVKDLLNTYISDQKKDIKETNNNKKSNFVFK